MLLRELHRAAFSFLNLFDVTYIHLRSFNWLAYSNSDEKNIIITGSSVVNEYCALLRGKRIQFELTTLQI